MSVNKSGCELAYELTSSSPVSMLASTKHSMTPTEAPIADLKDDEMCCLPCFGVKLGGCPSLPSTTEKGRITLKLPATLTQIHVLGSRIATYSVLYWTTVFDFPLQPGWYVLTRGPEPSLLLSVYAEKDETV